MPFPWKKVKNTRISQLVSDHIDSQRRRGGHLVVETGFPTSLVDLFVKNRERLKKPKPSKTKKTKNRYNSSISKPPLPSTSISPAASPSRSPLHPSPPPPLIEPPPLPQFDNGVHEADELDKRPNEGVNSKGVLLVSILRVLFVVVLALGTKKFALGLTMSAFVLFFVEYLGKHLYRLLMPCTEAKEKIRMIILMVLRVFGFREDRLEEGISSFKGNKGPMENNHGFGGPIREIQIAQPMGFLLHREEEIGKSTSVREEEILIKEDVNMPCCVGKLEPQGSNLKTVIMEDEEEYSCNIEKTKRVKLKLKMKQLFPRKLRSSKKGEPDLGGETSSNKVEPVSLCEGREEEGHGDGRELEGASKLSSLSSRRCEGNDAIAMISKISSFDVVLVEDVEGIVTGKEEENRKAGEAGYLILCLIILIGLFGGRISALLLLLFWCLMLKSGERLRRYVKLPAICSSDETTS